MKIRQYCGEAILWRSEMDDRYRELFLKNPLPVFVIDREKQSFLAVNESAKRHYGYSESEFLSMKYKDIVHDRDLEMGKEQSGRHERSKHRKKSNEIIDVETAVEPILFGSTQAKLILVHDVSERIRAEEALKESEERFSKAFHASPVATTITKLKNGLFIDINESFLKMTGYERAEVIGRTSLDLHIWSTPEDRNDFLALLKREGSMRDKERAMYTKHGEPLTILLSAELIELGGEPCLLMRLQNITETKRNLEKIRTYQDQLRLLASQLTLAEERERRRIAVDLHDCIGQNLAMIKVKLGVLQKEIPEQYSAKIEPMRELIEETIRSARSLSFQLSPPVLYELGLASALEWLTENTQEQYGIQIDFQKDEQPIAVADPLKVLLFSIIRELLMNVVKHSSAHSARVSFIKSSNTLTVCVEDDGIGFDTGSLSRPFGQSGGFGLFSIRERIANFGGRLDVRSKMGGGTKVTLTAPLETQEVQK